MINFEKYDDAALIARSKYYIVKKKQGEETQQLNYLITKLTNCTTQLSGMMQPKFEDVPASPADLLELCRWTINEMEKTAARITSLAQQKEDLRSIAWPSKERITT